VTLETIQEWEEVIYDKKPLIFYGLPGTGKTFMAEAFSKYLIKKYDREYIVQFYQCYSY
jgi:DNA replication protein DnaC